MAKFEIATPPPGYTLISHQGKIYPMALELDGQGVPVARGFLKLETGSPVSYVKRIAAINFLRAYKDGAISWAEVQKEGCTA